MLNGLSSLSEVHSGCGGNLWCLLFIPSFLYSGMSPCDSVLCMYLSTFKSILLHGARDGGTTFAALSHPILVPFLRVTVSPELLTRATATLLFPSFTVVYDSIACTSWKLPMFCMGSGVTFKCLERTGNHTIPVDFTAFLGWMVTFSDNFVL